MVVPPSSSPPYDDASSSSARHHTESPSNLHHAATVSALQEEAAHWQAMYLAEKMKHRSTVSPVEIASPIDRVRTPSDHIESRSVASDGRQSTATSYQTHTQIHTP